MLQKTKALVEILALEEEGIERNGMFWALLSCWSYDVQVCDRVNASERCDST